ncbi:MAG TPA: Arc family DNA-binding protein [Myxococcales bacterium]|jgi:hypothetical protein|nr:Arc family DNA-binding protein [Myxococcales bacterium]
MASFTVKNIPGDLLDALRKAAEGERRSLNQEILHLLTAALERRAEGAASPSPKVQEQLRAWRKLAGKWRSDLSIDEEIKRATRRRSGRREVDL